MVLHYVSTLAEVAVALAAFAKESVLSVDCEGVSLSRTGELCLIQVSAGLSYENGLRLFHVYLFDVVALGHAAFTTGLADILQAPTPTKLFYDVRRDSEALFHQFGVRLKGVCDMQLLEIANRRARNQNIVYLPGLARLIGERFPDMDSELQTIKDGMSGKYEEMPDLWRRRPLTHDQTVYAAIDVVLLHVLLAEMTKPRIMRKTRRVSTVAAPATGTTTTAAAGTTAASPTEAEAEMEEVEETEEEAKEKEPSAGDKAIEAAMAKLTGGSSAVASSASALASSSSSDQPPRLQQYNNVRVFISAQTRALVEQYSDIVWAASIRSAHTYTHTRTGTCSQHRIRTHPPSLSFPCLPKAVEA